MNYCSLCENPTANGQELCSVCQGDKMDEDFILDDTVPLDILFKLDDDNEYKF